MRKQFLTSYPLQGRTFTSFILADDRADAEKIAMIRNLGETIDSLPFDPYRTMTSPLVVFDRILTANEDDAIKAAKMLLHQVIFLLHIGESSGRFKEDGLFSDLGLIHQLYHIVEKTVPINSDLEDLRSIINRLGEASPEMFLTQQEADEILQIKRDKLLNKQSIVKRALVINTLVGKEDNELFDQLIADGKIVHDRDSVATNVSWFVNTISGLKKVVTGDVVVVDDQGMVCIRN